jgi:hypothetical protein
VEAIVDTADQEMTTKLPYRISFQTAPSRFERYYFVQQLSLARSEPHALGNGEGAIWKFRAAAFGS